MPEFLRLGGLEEPPPVADRVKVQPKINKMANKPIFNVNVGWFPMGQLKVQPKIHKMANKPTFNVCFLPLEDWM